MLVLIHSELPIFIENMGQKKGEEIWPYFCIN